MPAPHLGVGQLPKVTAAMLTKLISCGSISLSTGQGLELSKYPIILSISQELGLVILC